MLTGLRSTAFSTHKSEDAPLPVTLLEALPRRLLLLALHVLLLATSVAAVSVLDKKVQCEFRRAGLRADHHVARSQRNHLVFVQCSRPVVWRSWIRPQCLLYV